MADLFEQAVGQFGGLDAVVHVAGIQRSGAIEELDEADWDDQLRINPRSCVLTSNTLSRI